MSREKLQQLVGSLAKTIENNEKLATPVLAAKLAKSLAMHPHDQTLGAMSRVISKMADNQTLFISKADFKSLYNKLYSRNSKVAELFPQELGVTDHLSAPTVYERDEATQAVNPYEVGDAVLANALNSVFDNAPLKMYSQSLANKAMSSVASALDSWNLNPTHLIVEDGSEKFLVLKADYETPKGLTSFYVPVEVENNKIVDASIFMGNAGPQELNHNNIKSYLLSQTGSKLKINASSILNVLTKAASDKREITDTELALTRLNASREGKSEFFQGQIVGQKIAEASVKDVELPKYNEFSSFESQFTSPYGIAAFKLGEDTVKTARNHIVRELVGYGYKNPQVVVSNSDDSTIFYSVALNGGSTGFVVPVKLAGEKISKPTIMLCNGTAASFSKEGIEQITAANKVDYKAAAVASPQFGLKPSELINNIRQAIVEGNHAKAEDALNILANSKDDKAYATGFQIYLQGLAGTVVEATPSQCSMLIKNSKVSEHSICGHTGLPVHKVYQDKSGNCHPLYRRGMDETYEGASFMNAKILG